MYFGLSSCYIMVSLTEELNMKTKREIRTEANLANQALELLASFRGRIIVGRALSHIIEEMEKVEGTDREISTLADMHLLKDHFGIDLSE